MSIVRSTWPWFDVHVAHSCWLVASFDDTNQFGLVLPFPDVLLHHFLMDFLLGIIIVFVFLQVCLAFLSISSAVLDRIVKITKSGMKFFHAILLS